MSKIIITKSGVSEINKIPENIRFSVVDMIAKEPSYLMGHIVRNYLAGQKMSLQTSSQAKRSITPQNVKINKDTIFIGVNFAWRVMKFLLGEKGKINVIKPVAARALAIPLAAAKTKAGITRVAYGPAWGMPSLRDAMPNLKMIPRQGKPPLLVKVNNEGKTKGKRGESWTPMFVLLKQTTVRSRIHPEEIASTYLPELAKRLNYALQKAAKVGK